MDCCLYAMSRGTETRSYLAFKITCPAATRNCDRCGGAKYRGFRSNCEFLGWGTWRTKSADAWQARSSSARLTASLARPEPGTTTYHRTQRAAG